MKKLLLIFLTIASINAISQTVFVNELHYDNTGGDVNEGIEIAGPAGTDLTGYSLLLYNGINGVEYDSMGLSGIIPNQDNNYGTINFLFTSVQNGPDGFALIDPSNNVIQFLSYEGTFVAVDGEAIGMTSTDIGISEAADPLGESLQLIGIGTVYTDFTWTSQTQTRGLVNTGQSFNGVLSPTVSFDITSVSLGEATGTVTININITNADINPTSADVVLGVSSTATNGSDFTYTSPTTITFPGSSTMQQTVTLTITDDILVESSETIVLELQNVTNGGIVGNNAMHTITIIDNDATIIPACSELFFSEYMEGSSFNKALEIYNPSNFVIDLSDYEVRLFTNGSATPTSTLALSGLIVPGDVYVIAHGQAQSSILLSADVTSGVANFNGDDAVQLFEVSTGTVVDVIGEVGIDPGTEWIVGTGSTLDNVLVRMATIDAGTSAWTGVGDQQWDVFGQDDTLKIGSHTNTGCSSPILTAYPVISTDTVCVGDSLFFINSSYGGATPYTVSWDFGDGNSSTLDNPFNSYATGGTYTVTLTVTDAIPAVDDSIFTVFVNNGPSVTAMSDTIVCIGGTATLIASASGGTTPYSYLWSEGSTGASASVMPTAMTLYNVMVTDSNGCRNFSNNITVDLNAPLVVTVSGGGVTLCQGDTVQLSAVATGGLAPYSYAWLPSGGGAIINVTPSSTTTYTAVASDACETPNDTSMVTVTVTSGFADYTFTGAPTVSFTDLSQGNIASWAWDFGDGNTSTSANPTNTYVNNGSYTVCLTVTTTEGCQFSTCNPIQINGVGINEFDLNDITLYPNPTTNNQITIVNENNEKLSVTVSNVIGQKVWSGTISKTEIISLPELQKGNYFVRISTTTGSTTKKLMIK